MARDHTEIVNTDEFDEPRQMTRNLRPLNQMYDINKKMRPSKIGLISIMLLYSTYILLPLEAGFPRVKIFGFEVESSITFSVIAFFMACYVNKKDFIHFKIDNYIIFQSLFVFVLMLGGWGTEFPLSSLRAAIAYFFAWVINYMIIQKYIDMGYAKYITLIVCVVVFFSAMEAILEGLQLVIPIYADWHINYEHSWENENENFGRVLGTVGNPLVLGVVFMLAIPFAMSIKNVYLKIIMILLIIAGAFLTVSKTVIVLAAINLFYYFVIIGRKHVAKSAILFALVLAILIMMTYSNKLMENPYVKLWTIRLTMETDNDLIDSRSISMRKDSAVNSFNKIVNGDVDKMLIGYGHATHVMISEAIEANFRTLDNVYLQVWHNNGIIGLIIFLIAFLYPAMNKRSLKYQTTYWFNALNFMLVGFSLVCYPYSAINILMVTSYALMNKKSDSNHVIYSCTVN